MSFFRLRARCFVLALLMAAMGCSRDPAQLDRRDEWNPLLQKAREHKARQDIEGALELYNRALEQNPRLARAHLELGELYSNEKKDYVRAIYHFQRYLELRPQTEKREVIEQMIQQARVQFAATLPVLPPGAVEEIAELRREVERLRKKAGESATAPAVASTPKPPPGELSPPAPAPVQPPVVTYVVEPNDTLSRIAARVYGDASKWKVIYDANRHVLKTPEGVRPGQTLVIPSVDRRGRGTER